MKKLLTLIAIITLISVVPTHAALDLVPEFSLDDNYYPGSPASNDLVALALFDANNAYVANEYVIIPNLYMTDTDRQYIIARYIQPLTSGNSEIAIFRDGQQYLYIVADNTIGKIPDTMQLTE